MFRMIFRIFQNFALAIYRQLSFKIQSIDFQIVDYFSPVS